MVENRLSRHEELRYQYLLRNLEYLSEREKQEFDYLYQKKLASFSSPSHYTQPAAPHDPRPIYQEVNDQAYDGYDDYANWEDEKQWTAPGLPKYPDEAPPKRSKKAKRACRFADVSGERPKKKKRHFFKRLMKWLALLVVATMAGMIYMFFKGVRDVSEGNTNYTPGVTETFHGENSPDGTNILILGSDQRVIQGSSDARTATIMVMNIGNSDDKIK